MGLCHADQPPVLLFFALMAGAEDLLRRCEQRLESEFGPIDARDATYDFDLLTDYYAREFGLGLRKRLVTVEPLIAPEALVQADGRRRLREEWPAILLFSSTAPI